MKKIQKYKKIFKILIMRTTIIVRTENTIEAYTGFKKMCTLLNLPYNYLKRLPYPINYKGIIIDKVELK